MPRSGVRRGRAGPVAAAGVSVALALALSLAVGAAGAANAMALAQAKTHLLKLSDMPKGWTSQKNTNGSGGKFPGQDKLATCIGVPTSTITLNPPSVNSPEFDNSATTQTLTENIAVFSSSRVGQKEYAAIASPKTPGCYAQILNGPIKRQLQAGFGTGAVLGKITAARASAASAVGFTIRFTVKLSGRTLPLALTSLFALHGTEGMQLQFTGIGTSFPTSVENQLTSVALGRL